MCPDFRDTQWTNVDTETATTSLDHLLPRSKTKANPHDLNK
jgi:hypothetical protein